MSSESDNQDIEPLEQEDEFIGMESHLVPTIDPAYDDDFGWVCCNAKKTENIQDEDRGTLTLFTGYCNSPAGSGTDHTGEGRCKFHGGAVEGAGAPKHNQNATKHGANVDPHHYAQSLPSEEEEFLRDVSATIQDRIRSRKGEVDFLDRVISRRIAVELHIVAKESDYVENVSGLLQTIVTEHDSHEEKSPLLDDIRRRDKDILNMLKQIGVLDDPESKKADALESWRSFVEGEGEEEEIIDVSEHTHK